MTETPENENHVEAAHLKWKSFTAQNRISNKGMCLKFVAPIIKNGARIAKLDKILRLKGKVNVGLMLLWFM